MARAAVPFGEAIKGWWVSCLCEQGLRAYLFVLWGDVMTCTECATPCEAIGDGPYVIFICLNCGQVIDPEKATCDDLDEQRERYWA